MSQFENINLKYTPTPILNDLSRYSSKENGESSSTDDLANEEIADKLLAHLALIKDFRDKITAIDYLIDGAAKLAGNPTYTTNDQYLINDIAHLGGNSNVIDFDLFKKAVDLVIKGYEQMALKGLVGGEDV